MRARQILIIVFVLYFAALAVRLVPYGITPLPYNIDSLAECRMASDIVQSGGLSYPDGAVYIGERHGTVTPLYNVFLAMCSVVIGMQPGDFAPLLLPAITSFSAIAVFFILLRMTGNKYAAAAGGFFLAFSGTYVAVTLAPWKEAFGFLLVPIIVFLYAGREDDWRMHALAVGLLLILPLWHHLVTAAAYLAVAFMALIPAVPRLLERRLRRHDKVDAAVLGCLWALAFAYYSASRFNRMEFFGADSGVWLFLSVFLLLLFIGIYAARPTPTRLGLVMWIPLIVCLIFIANYFVPVFPYTTATNRDLLLYIAPYLLLVYPVLAGFAVIIDSASRQRIMLIALFTAPFTIMLFAFLWGLSATTSYPMIIRAYDFLDIGLAIAVGAGIAWIARKLRRPSARAALGVAFVAGLLATTTIAYNTNSVFKIENYTYQYELDTVKWVKEVNAGKMNFTSDRRVWELANRLYDIEGEFILPIAMKTQKLPKNYICIIEDRWTREPGAQLWPLDSYVVPTKDMTEHILPQNNLVVCTGPQGDFVYVMVRPV